MKKIILSFLLLLPTQSLALGTGLEEAAPPALRKFESVPYAVNVLINAALSLLGVIFIIMVILAGFKWMTAQGDAKKVEEARDNIKNAVMGLVVVLAAYAITKFIFDVLLNDGTGGNTIPDGAQNQE